jgi:hypothetical protein
MRTYRQHSTVTERQIVWMVTLFAALTMLFSLILVRPAH